MYYDSATKKCISGDVLIDRGELQAVYAKHATIDDYLEIMDDDLTPDQLYDLLFENSVFKIKKHFKSFLEVISENIPIDELNDTLYDLLSGEGEYNYDKLVKYAVDQEWLGVIYETA